MLSKLSRPVAVATICLGLGIFSFGQDYVSAVIEGDAADFPAQQTLLYEILRWAFWTPIILVMLRLPTAIAAGGQSKSRIIGLHLTLAVLALVSQAFYQAAIVKAVFGEIQTYLTFVRIFLTRAIQVQLFTYLAMLSVILMIASSKRARERERTAGELERQLAQARLRALEAQLHPHFLFNTLQTVSMLVRKDPDLAAQTIVRLGDLLRITLDKTEAHEVSLEEELEALALYVEIGRTRFADRLVVEIRVPDILKTAAVPHLILQPLVENALQYAVEPRVSGGTVHVEAKLQNNQVLLTVTDDGPGLPAGNPSEGIGLSNTRERLRTLYGEDSLAIHNLPQGGCEAQITLPWRTRAAK